MVHQCLFDGFTLTWSVFGLILLLKRLTSNKGGNNMFCHECGKELDEKSIYCPNCGAKCLSNHHEEIKTAA